MLYMIKTWVSLLFLVFFSINVAAHCQIPCGIYDDARQFSELKEHVKTIEKSIASIQTLSDGSNANQLTRWVTNKETHATEIQNIINHYFLIQRIKAPTKSQNYSTELYNQLLQATHKILVQAMKTKQNTNLDFSSQLLDDIKAFEKIYNQYKS